MTDTTPYTNLVTSEHADKQKFMNTIAVSCAAFADSAAFLASIPAMFDIDTAVGNQLDVVGIWVGISRALPIPLTGVYFTLDSGPGFDSGILIGPFDPVAGLTMLPDSFYRLLLKAKILNNHWDGSMPSAYLLSSVVFASYGYTLFIQDNYNLTMNLGLLGPGTPPVIVQAMLIHKLLDVKPATVNLLSYIWQARPGPIFMFDAQIGSTHFAGFDSGTFAVITTP
jgi:hypothetical protein